HLETAGNLTSLAPYVRTMKQRGPRGGFFGVIATCVSLAAALSPSPGAGLPSEQVWITEFMAVNTTGLVDRDREHADWIELHNPGSAPVDLQGWHLTDKRSDLTKWRFPSTVLGPGEFLIVFASKKDRRLAGAELHTNFKL